MNNYKVEFRGEIIYSRGINEQHAKHNALHYLKYPHKIYLDQIKTTILPKDYDPRVKLQRQQL